VKFDFVHYSKEIENAVFLKLHMCQSSGVGRETSILLGPLDLSKGPNKVGVSLPFAEDGNRHSFRNVLFSYYLDYRAMDKI
jgi:hypothetical protein